MRIEPLTSSIGAAVDGVDLRAIDATTCADLHEALARHGVLVFHDQTLSRDEQVACTARFGPVHGHPVREYLVGGDDDPLAVVENRADKPPQEDQHFHTDYSFSPVVPDLAVLRAEVIPDRGGDTIWSSAHAAFDALSGEVRSFIAKLDAVHDAGPQFWFEYERTVGEDAVRKASATFRGVIHPVITAHPRTGRPLLFVNPAYTTAIVGLRARESRALLEMLYDQIRDPAFHYRHKWRAGDVVMWDEHATLHMGPNDFGSAERRLTRVTAGRSAPRRAGTSAGRVEALAATGGT